MLSQYTIESANQNQYYQEKRSSNITSNNGIDVAGNHIQNGYNGLHWLRNTKSNAVFCESHSNDFISLKGNDSDSVILIDKNSDDSDSDIQDDFEDSRTICNASSSSTCK